MDALSSLNSSASSLITSAQQKVANAATTIANLSVQNDEVGGSQAVAGDMFKPVVSLKEAEWQNSAGVKLLQTERQTLGSLLDIKV
jgi:hypothetical protein